MEIKVGDVIKIIEMIGEPQYSDKIGVVTHIDDMEQIHGTWGGCAVCLNLDKIEILRRTAMNDRKCHIDGFSK